MKKDFLAIDGQQYRVEVNMNTVENWEQLSGKKVGQFEAEAAASVNAGGVATRAMLLWLFCAIIEGEELEGRTFATDFQQFKRMVRPGEFASFAPIFIGQYIPNALSKDKIPDNKEDDATKKKKTILHRLAGFVRSPWVIFAGILLISLYVARLFLGTH